MKVRIITSKKELYEGEAKQVVLPGQEEEFSILDFHQPFLYRLQRGYVKVLEAGPKPSRPAQSFFIKDGIAKMLNNNLTVLAEA